MNKMKNNKMADVETFFHEKLKKKEKSFNVCHFVIFNFFFTILLPAIAIYVLFKNYFVFLLSDAPMFRNHGRQQKGVFFFRLPYLRRI